MLVFSKEKMIERLKNEGRFSEIDDDIIEIMNNIDGQEARTNSWRRQVFDDAVLSVKGKDGKYYDVNECDCVFKINTGDSIISSDNSYAWHD